MTAQPDDRRSASVNRTAAHQRLHENVNGSGSPPARTVLGYRDPADKARAEQPPSYGPGLLQGFGGFVSAISLAAVGLCLGGFAVRVAVGGAWLMGVGPILLTLSPAVRVVRSSSRPSRRAYRDGFLAGTIIVCLVGLITIAATFGGPFNR